MSIIDIGFDANQDKHCDLDGWFVNKAGRHTPIIREYDHFHNLDYFKTNYTIYNLLKNFDVKGHYSGLNLNPLNRYSLNKLDLDDSSPTINNYLRASKEKDNSIDSYVRQIDGLIDKFSINNPINVFRGIKVDLIKYIPFEIYKLKKGDIYSDNAFMSTSYSMQIASGYSLDGDGPYLMFDIELSKGTKCIPLFKGGPASKSEEFEILVNRGQKFLVLDKCCRIIKNKKIYVFKMKTINV